MKKRSKLGYKRYSPDVNNPYNIISSGRITMKDVDFPVYGVDNFGNQRMMYPGGEYQFPGNEVFEIPMAQTGFQYNGSWRDVAPRPDISERRDATRVAPPVVVPQRVVNDRLHIDRANQRDAGTISQYVAPNIGEQVVNKLANPMTTLGYIARGESIPDMVPVRDNTFDMAIDIINPASYVEAGMLAKNDVQNDNYLGAAVNAAGFFPFVPTFSKKTVGNLMRKPIADVERVIAQDYTSNLLRPKTPLQLTEGTRYYRAATQKSVDDMFEPIIPSASKIAYDNTPQVQDLRFFTPNRKVAEHFYDVNRMDLPNEHNRLIRVDMDFKNPHIIDQNTVWSYKQIKDLIDQGHDAIINFGRNRRNYDLTGSINDAYEVIPLNKELIRNVEYLRKRGGEQLLMAQLGGMRRGKVDRILNENRDLNFVQRMYPGAEYQFPGNRVFEIPMAQNGIEVPKRQGSRKNPDGTESTHLMATETLDGKNWFSFPTLFQDPDGSWVDMSNRPWQEAYEEAKRRAEVIDFGTDKEAAIKFGEGSWKTPKYQQRGEVVLDPRRTIEQDNTRVKQVIVPQEFRQPSRPVQLTAEQRLQQARMAAAPAYARPVQSQATVSQYNPPSTFEYLLNKAANPMTTLGYVVRGQDIPDRVGDKDNALDYASEVINPAAWLDYGIKAADDLSEGDFVGAALNALGTIPAVPATVATARNIARPVVAAPIVKAIAKPLARVADDLGNKFLPNTYEYNPWAFKTDPNKFYRQIDNVTYREGVESGLIKGKQDIGFRGHESGSINLNKSFGDDAYYNKGSLYYKDNTDLPYLFEANLPEERFIPKVNNRTKKYTTENTSVRVSKEPIPINDPSIKLYKKDWLKGYKPMQYQQGGHTYSSGYKKGGLVKAQFGIQTAAFMPMMAQAYGAVSSWFNDDSKPATTTPAAPENVDWRTLSRPKQIDYAIGELTAFEKEENRKALENLLESTAYMENRYGEDPRAYGRDYTSSFMSIDPIALKDMFTGRGANGAYNSAQRRQFETFKQLDLPTDQKQFDALLREDNPVAAIAAARYRYALVPQALPSANDQQGMFDYWLKYYNGSGILKHKTRAEAYKDFQRAYQRALSND